MFLLLMNLHNDLKDLKCFSGIGPLNPSLANGLLDSVAPVSAANDANVANSLGMKLSPIEMAKKFRSF